MRKKEEKKRKKDRTKGRKTEKRKTEKHHKAYGSVHAYGPIWAAARR